MITGTLTLVEEICCSCFTHFAMDAALNRKLRESGGTFYCPSGHGQHYTETEVQKLKKKNQSLQNSLTWTEQACADQYQETQQIKKDRAVIKGQLTRTRKRIANGVCPCCYRTFQQLSRHIENKHPDFKRAVG
jgi:hypothetical protein